jgi:hypothetical protein
VTGRHQRTSRAAELAVERARWEARLAALADAEQALAAAQDALPPLPDRASLARLTADLPALWHAPTTTARDRKRLLRTLIADIHVLLSAPRHALAVVDA